MYYAYITRIKNLKPHPNADRLQMGECFGNSVIVSLEYEDNQLGIYFPTDGQVSMEFAEANNLLRKKDDAGNNIGGYMDPDKRNITAIRLRGEKSDGLFLPLSCLAAFGDISSLTEGERINVFNGHEICTKYIPRRNPRSSRGGGNKARKHKEPIAPTFAEHADTEQLNYNLEAFKPGDQIEITLKMHGTSGRTGYLPIHKPHSWKTTSTLAGAILKILPTDSKLYNWVAKKYATPNYEYGYISGTRRVVLDNFEGGYYGSNEFREQHANILEGKLWKGETVYYEIVGFTHTGAPIMGNGNNEKLGKDFVKQYGKETVFSYGCKPIVSIDCDDLQSDMYVYRMTMTNEDGDVIEYTPDFMRYRCEQMGVKCVPVFWSGLIPENPASKTDPTISAGEWIKEVAEEYYDGPDPIGKTHIREGVVVRIVNRPKFTAYKTKNFSFKVIEGIIKDTATTPDMEEAQEVDELS